MKRNGLFVGHGKGVSFELESGVVYREMELERWKSGSLQSDGNLSGS